MATDTSIGEEIYQSTTEHPDPVDAEIEGEVPQWLKGDLLRVGPGKFEWGNMSYNHWFDGDAILNRFSIENGNVKFSSRFLRSRSYLESEKNNRIVFSQFGTNAPPDPCKNIFSRFFSYFTMGEMTDNCNVNIVKMKGENYASTETTRMWKIDKESLDSLDPVDFGKKLSGPRSWLAHPHYDQDGNYYNISTSYIKRQNEIYKVPPAKTEKEDNISGLEMISSFPCKDGPTYYHSFGMTENYFIFIQTSVSFSNPIGMLFMKLMDWSYVDFLKFNPKLKSSFYVIDRKTGKVGGRFLAQPFMCFHQVNGYETDKEIVFDMCGYPDGSIIQSLYLSELRKGIKPEVHPPELRRYHLPLEKIDLRNPPTLLLDTNSDGLDYDLIFTGLELPRINYEENNGKDYNFVYGNGLSHKSGAFSNLYKVDVKTKETKSWDIDNCYPSEPVFIPHPNAKREDDGVVLSAVIGVRGQKSFLLVLNGEDMTEVARAYIPVKLIPLIHGEFL